MVRQIERKKKKGAKLYKMAQVIGCEGNKSEDQLPESLLITKRCHNGTEQLQAYYNEKLGFTLEDPMCFAVNVGNIYNQVTKLRMIPRGFVYYKKTEGESESKYAEAVSKGKNCSA